MNDQEKGTIVDHGKRVGVINLGVEIAMMIITEREAESERDTGIGIGTETGSATESENTVIVRRWAFHFIILFSMCVLLTVIITPRLLFIHTVNIPTF